MIRKLLKISIVAVGIAIALLLIPIIYITYQVRDIDFSNIQYGFPEEYDSERW